MASSNCLYCQQGGLSYPMIGDLAKYAPQIEVTKEETEKMQETLKNLDVSRISKPEEKYHISLADKILDVVWTAFTFLVLGYSFIQIFTPIGLGLKFCFAVLTYVGVHLFASSCQIISNWNKPLHEVLKYKKPGDYQIGDYQIEKTKYSKFSDLANTYTPAEANQRRIFGDNTKSYVAYEKGYKLYKQSQDLLTSKSIGLLDDMEKISDNFFGSDTAHSKISKSQFRQALDHAFEHARA